MKLEECVVSLGGVRSVAAEHNVGAEVGEPGYAGTDGVLDVGYLALTCAVLLSFSGGLLYKLATRSGAEEGVHRGHVIGVIQRNHRRGDTSGEYQHRSNRSKFHSRTLLCEQSALADTSVTHRIYIPKFAVKDLRSRSGARA